MVAKPPIDHRRLLSYQKGVEAYRGPWTQDMPLTTPYDEGCTSPYNHDREAWFTGWLDARTAARLERVGIYWFTEVRPLA